MAEEITEQEKEAVVKALAKKLTVTLSPPELPKLLGVTAFSRVSCPHSPKCTSYPDKCPQCRHNEAGDYFEAKEG